MKVLAAGWLACLLVFQDPSPGNSPVSVRIESLFGAGQSNTWATLILEVTNKTSSDQEFHIYVDIGWADRALRREKFAPKVRKRLFFYLPTGSYSSRINVNIQDPSGRELLAQDLDMALGGYSSYSSYNSPTRLLPALMDRLPVQLPANCVAKQIPEDLFPDRWIGLAGTSTLLIRDYRLESLLPAQRAALLEWVKRGGEVILYAGSNRDWLTSAAVQELAPVMLGESQEVRAIPALENAYGPFRERAPFACHKILNGEPLGEPFTGVAKFRNGMGQVIVVPFDLERAPFDSWPGTADLRLGLMIGSRRGDSEGRGLSVGMPPLCRDGARIFQAATAKVNRLPPFLLLLGLTLVYLVVVGPVNFLVLRRLRMTVRLVFTIPAISAVFLGIVVASGYFLRGTSTVTYDVCMLETRERSGLAFEHHHLSLFAPTPRSYDIAFGDGETGLPEEGDPDDYRRYRRSYERSMNRGVVFDQTDRWTLKGVALQQWQARAFVGEAVRPIGGGVSFKFGDGIEVTNRTPYTIRKGWAIEKYPAWGAAPFGEVPPGETRKFPITSMGRPIPRSDWQDLDDLEERLVAVWMLTAFHQQPFRPFLLCALDRLPDEITISAARSSQSERLCFLQVGSEP